MTRKQHERQSETDNMRSSVNSDSQAKELRGDQTTTSLKRAVARRNGRPPNRLNLLAGLSSADLQRLARKTHCLRGHEFSPENTRPHGDGNRSCKACEKIRNAKRNPLGLPHSATTPMPDALRSFMGARRVAVEKSPYAVRAERKGQLVELVEFLRRVRAEVRDGSTLTQAVADGTLWGWRARQALSHSIGEPVATWDAQPGRTQMERRAVVERSLTECGDVARKGGWRVSR